MNETIANAIAALLIALIPIAGAYARSYAKSHFTPSRLADIQNVARVAVAGVERQFGPGAGQDKFAAAQRAVHDAAAKLGLPITDDLASSLIHAALAELEKAESFNQQQVGDAIEKAYQTGFVDGMAGTEPQQAAA